MRRLSRPLPYYHRACACPCLLALACCATLAVSLAPAGERARHADARRRARRDRGLRAGRDARARNARTLGSDHRSHANAARHHAGLRESRRADAGHAADALRHRLDHEIDDGARAAAAVRRRTGSTSTRRCSVTCPGLRSTRRAPILVHELLSHTAGLPDDFAARPATRTTSSRCATPRRSSRRAPRGRTRTTATRRPARSSRKLDGRSWADALTARVFEPLGNDRAARRLYARAMAERGDRLSVPRQRSARAAASAARRRRRRWISSIPPARCSRRPKTWRATCASISTAGRTARRTAADRTGDVRRDDASRSSGERQARGVGGRRAGRGALVLPQYGYGLSIFDDGGDHLVGHTGGISGYTACMQMNLTRGFGVIAFANLVEAPLHPCAIVLYAMRVLRAQSSAKPLPAPARRRRIRARVAHARAITPARIASPSGALTASREPRRPARSDRRRQNDRALSARRRTHFWADDPQYATLPRSSSGAIASGNVVEMTYGSQWYAERSAIEDRARSRIPPRGTRLVGRYENTFFGEPCDHARRHRQESADVRRNRCAETAPERDVRARQLDRAFRSVRRQPAAATVASTIPTLSRRAAVTSSSPISHSRPRSFFENERNAISVSVLRIPSSAATCSVTRSLSCSCCLTRTIAIRS